jgi:hypothetical protein
LAVIAVGDSYVPLKFLDNKPEGAPVLVTTKGSTEELAIISKALPDEGLII